MNQANCVVQRIYARSLLSGGRCSFSPSRGCRFYGFDSGPPHVNCKPHLLFSALVLLVCSANPTAVFAAPLDWFKFGPTQAVDVVTISYGSFNNLAVYAGQYTGTIASTQAGLSSPLAQTFNTFCVDLADEVTVGQVYEVAQTPTSGGLTNGGAIAYLYNTYGLSLITGSNVNGSGLNSDDYAAALQLAIWDELANNGQAPHAGSALQYSGLNPGVAAQVQQFLTLANSNSSNAIWLDSNVPQPPGFTPGQGFIAPVGQGLFVPAPEPPTVVLLSGVFCCACGGFGYRRRRSTGLCP